MYYYYLMCLPQPKDFNSCYIPGSLNFALGGAGGAIVGPEDGNFAIWVSLEREGGREGGRETYRHDVIYILYIVHVLLYLLCTYT